MWSHLNTGPGREGPEKEAEGEEVASLFPAVTRDLPRAVRGGKAYLARAFRGLGPSTAHPAAPGPGRQSVTVEGVEEGTGERSAHQSQAGAPRQPQ